MRRTAVLALSALLLPRLASAEAPLPAAPVAILYDLAGEASCTIPGQPSRAARLFEFLPAEATVQIRAGARATLALANGLRWELGGRGGAAQITLGKAHLAAQSGDVRPLPKLPRLPRLKPIRKEDHAGYEIGAYIIRGERIAGLYPRGDARTLAGATVLRFKPLGGADRYRVEIQDDQGNAVFSAETAEPRVAVPGQTLRPGTRYHWTVRTIDRPGAKGEGLAGFETLDADSAQRRGDLLSSTGDPEVFVLVAGLDRRLGLLAEARDELAKVIEADPANGPLRAVLEEVERELGEGR